ncbi:MAG: hypothetical protein KBF71_06705, partial [Alphaproteobacteria bacterium]|nr:hypothetical protein [Alphaproteobacteria bacterium]
EPPHAPPKGGPAPHAPPKGGVKVPPPPPRDEPPHAPPKGGPAPHAPPKGGVKVPPPPPRDEPPHAPPKGGPAPHAPPKGGVKVPPPPPRDEPPHAPPKGGPAPHAPPKGGVKVPPPPPADVSPPHPAPPKAGLKPPTQPGPQAGPKPPAQPGPQAGLKPPAQPGPQAGLKPPAQPGPQAGLKPPAQPGAPVHRPQPTPPKKPSVGPTKPEITQELEAFRMHTRLELRHLMELHLEAKQRIVEIEKIIQKEKEKAKQTAPDQKPSVDSKKPPFSPAKPNPVLQEQRSALEKAKQVLNDTFQQIQALLARFGIGTEKYMAKLAALEDKPYDTQNRPSPAPSPEPPLRVRPSASNRVSTQPSPVVSPAPSPRQSRVSRVSRPLIPTPPNLPNPRRSRVQLKREMEQLAAQIEAKRNQMRLGGDTLRESRAARFNAAEAAGKKKPAIRPSLLMNTLNELKKVPKPVEKQGKPLITPGQLASAQQRLKKPPARASRPKDQFLGALQAKSVDREKYEERIVQKLKKISTVMTEVRAQLSDIIEQKRGTILRSSNENHRYLLEQQIHTIESAMKTLESYDTELLLYTLGETSPDDMSDLNDLMIALLKYQGELATGSVPVKPPALPDRFKSAETKALEEERLQKQRLLNPTQPTHHYVPGMEIEAAKNQAKIGPELGAVLDDKDLEARIQQTPVLDRIKDLQQSINAELAKNKLYPDAQNEVNDDMKKLAKFRDQHIKKLYTPEEMALLQDYMDSIAKYQPESKERLNWYAFPRLPEAFHPMERHVAVQEVKNARNELEDILAEIGNPEETAEDIFADIDAMLGIENADPAEQINLVQRASRTAMEDLDALLSELGPVPRSSRLSVARPSSARPSFSAMNDLDNLLGELGGVGATVSGLLDEASHDVNKRQSVQRVSRLLGSVSTVIRQTLSNPRLSAAQRQSVGRISTAIDRVSNEVLNALVAPESDLQIGLLDKITMLLNKIDLIQNRDELISDYESELEEHARDIAHLDPDNIDDLLDMHEEIDLIEAYIDNALLLEAAQTQPTGTRQEQFDALEQVVDGIADPAKRAQVMDAYRDVAQTYPFLSNDDQERALSVIREYIVNIGEVDPDAPPRLKTPAEQLAALEHEINALPDHEDKEHLGNLHLEIMRNMNRVSGVDEDDMLDQIDLLRDQIEETRDKILNPEKYAPQPVEDESDTVQVAPNAMMNKVDELTAQLDDLANSRRGKPSGTERPSLASEPSTQTLDSLLNSLKRPSTSTRPSEAVDEPIDQAHLEKFLQNVRNDIMGGPEAAAAIEKQKKAIMSLYVTPTLKSIEKLKSKSNPVALSLVSEFEKLTEELKKVILDPTGINNPQELEDKQKVLKKTIKELEKKFVDLSEQINEEAEEGKKPLSTPAIDQMLDNIRPTEQQELDALLFEASDLVKSVRHNPQPTSVEEQLRILEDLAKSLPSGTITLDPRKVGRMEKPPQVEPSTPPEVSTSETKKSRFSDEERQLLEELASDPEDSEVPSGEVSEDEMEDIDNLLKDLDKN